ncbi:hypothetical protein AAF712_006699 [Marasmius tenuissimus]|uniref:YDG domain-containing protein n=1 Tax=Marasmius tenuissimus TaxID=585030 RepID=A0ABR2ZY43_9AGAR
MATERLRKQLAENRWFYPAGLPQETPTGASYFSRPSVKVGTLFSKREDVKNARLHNHNFAGIAHREGRAFAIVLSGGYEDDEDHGDVILYTGTGGQKDPFSSSGQAQTFDQTFDDAANKALQQSFMNKISIRVIRRGGKDTKHSKYAPILPAGQNQIYRYDGLYDIKEVNALSIAFHPTTERNLKCREDKGKAGFKICRFRLEV